MAEMSQEPQGSFTQANDEQAVYEIGFHVVPTAAPEDALAVAERIKAELQKEGASIIAHEDPKRLNLAYRVERSVAGKREKYNESYFGWVKFEAMPEVAQRLQEFARGERSILRFILIHTIREEVKIAPRAVFSSDRLEGTTIEKKVATEAERTGPVSDEEIDKSLEALVS